MVHDCIFMCLGVPLYQLNTLLYFLLRSKPNTALREEICTFCKIDDLKKSDTNAVKTLQQNRIL